MSGAARARRHWWLERLSAAALAPLSVWFVHALVVQDLGRAAAFAAWLHRPGEALLLALFLLVSLHHAWLGLTVIVDDYVAAPGRNRWTHRACRLALLAALAAAAAGMVRLLG